MVALKDVLAKQIFYTSVDTENEKWRWYILFDSKTQEIAKTFSNTCNESWIEYRPMFPSAKQSQVCHRLGYIYFSISLDFEIILLNKKLNNFNRFDNVFHCGALSSQIPSSNSGKY